MPLINMAPMSTSTLSSRFLSCLRRRHQRHHSAHVFADSDSDTGPSASQPFQTNLPDTLQRLTDVSNDDDAQPCSPSSKLSPLITWVCQALDVVVAAQGSVKQVLLTHTMAHASSSHQKRMQHYMQANVKMLDACRLLEETLRHILLSRPPIKQSSASSGSNSQIRGTFKEHSMLCCLHPKSQTQL
ncbi:hypothetical protein L7F22_031284 [Adiantum nelumboides]|nr:hypothetical protein [Adiantum nelumboides]